MIMLKLSRLFTLQYTVFVSSEVESKTELSLVIRAQWADTSSFLCSKYKEMCGNCLNIVKLYRVMCTLELKINKNLPQLSSIVVSTAQSCVQIRHFEPQKR